ncbi:MAG: AEC family transporter [Firmicutes bacterium]|nr:AEC family transporter [Bacillota bacterium]
MAVIVNNILPIFFIIAMGFVANRRGILPNEANKYLVDMVMLVTCPCLIISSMLGQEMDPSLMTNTVLMFLGGGLFFLVFYIIAWIYVVKIMKIPANQDAGVYMIMFTTVNNGFIGFPVTYAIFGDEILFYMVIFQIMLIVYVYSAGVIQVNYGSPRVSDLKGMAKALVNTCTMSTVLSVVLLVLGIRLPEVVFNAVELVGSATTPVSMLVVGMQLGNSNFRQVLGNKRLVVMSFVKMLSVPLLTFLMVNWLPIADSLKIALVFGATFPVSVSVVTISSMEGKNSVLAAEGVALTTLMAMATLPVSALLLSSYYL